MCGRYLFSQKDDDEEVIQWIEELRKEETPETLAALALNEVRPTNLTLVLVLNDGLHPKVMRWGLPKWDNKGILINTRSETALTSSIFKKHMKERRCIIKAAGFYEWDDEKNRYLITGADNAKLCIAGLYDAASRPGFSVLTRDAEGAFAAIHQRIPLLIPQQFAQRYLADGDILLGDLCKFPFDDLTITEETLQTRLF